MEVKNLIGKLHAHEESPQVPKVPSPPTPRNPAHTQVAGAPVIEDNVRTVQFQQEQHASGGISKMREELEDGIILDLGEGISLNIPIQRRMSLSDFIKLAEKVKALEMLSESQEMYHKG